MESGSWNVASTKSIVRREKRDNLNCRPLSVVMISETLNMETHSQKRVAATIGVVESDRGMASGEQVHLSIMTLYLKP